MGTPLTESPCKVELGSGCLDGNEGIGQSAEERGLADELWVNVVGDWERFGDGEKPEHAASTHQQLLAHSPLRRRHIYYYMK